MPSTFTWLDSSEEQRRMMKEALDLFREPGTRDELGISTIRDGFANILFPGTGALQTRARYFFFVPWMYRQLEERRIPSVEIDRRARRYEIDLIEALLASDDREGTIGRQARASLQRLPSSIYWSGLGTLRIRSFGGSQEEYHRSLDRYYRARRGIKNDDGEPLDEVQTNWHRSLIPPPDGFPRTVVFALRREEAEFLIERIVSADPGSLFAFLVNHLKDYSDIALPWEAAILDACQPRIRRQLIHARNFSTVIHGGALLYNLMLSELSKKDDLVERFEEDMSTWSAEIVAERGVLTQWNVDDFWSCVAECHASIGGRTRTFVDTWIDLVRRSTRPDRLFQVSAARELIRERECALKGALARLENPRARELWNGAAGLGRLTYRWPNAQTVCADLLNGLSD